MSWGESIPIIGSVGILAYLLGRAIIRCEFEIKRDVARKRLGLGQPMGDWPHVPDDFGNGCPPPPITPFERLARANREIASALHQLEAGR